MKENELFGLTEKEAENVRDVVPTYNLSQLAVGKSARFKVTEAEPREIEFTDKESGQKKVQKVINVIHKESGQEFTIWLSSKTLRMEFLKLYKKRDNLKDLDIVIGARQFKSEKYGLTRAYSVSLDMTEDGSSE